jgi:PAS domain S-box-containing protein
MGLKVLIVDDDESVRRGLRTLLSLSTDNISVCGEATDGNEAVAKTIELKPDVVLMDVRMPGMNGLEATREIVRLLPRTQIILLSNYEIAHVKQEGVKAGAVDYVTKSEIWNRLLPSLRKLSPEHEFSDTEMPGDGDVHGANGDASRDFRAQFRNAEERFRATFEQSAVGMAHVANDGHWLRANQKLCEILGYSREEIEQLTLQDVIYPRDMLYDFEQGRRMAVGEIERYCMEQRYVRKDGKTVPVRLTVDAVRNPNGKLKYCVRVLETTSATTQKTVRDLQIANKQLALLTSRLSAALTRCSRDLRYVWVNDNYAKWMQLAPEKIIGRRILDVFGKEAFQTLQPRFEQVLLGRNVQYKQKVSYAGIGLRHISAAYSPTLDSTGKTDGWVALVEDITIPKSMVMERTGS